MPCTASPSQPVMYRGDGTHGGKSIIREVGRRHEVDPVRRRRCPLAFTTRGAECFSSSPGGSVELGMAPSVMIRTKNRLTLGHSV